MSESMQMLGWGLLILFLSFPVLAVAGALYGNWMYQRILRERAAAEPATDEDDEDGDPLIQVGDLWVRAADIRLIRALPSEPAGPRVVLRVDNIAYVVVIECDSVDAAHGIAKHLADRIGFVKQKAAT